MKYLIFIVLICLQAASVRAATTIYDFSNRTPPTDTNAYEGISDSQLPSNNSFPSTPYLESVYSDIASNDNGYHDFVNYTKNQYPSIRYVVKIDEEANTVNQLNIFWNGYGANSKKNKTDGVRIYIWNNNSNSYDFVTQNTNDWVVELEQNITSNIANYIDNSNKITIYVVSQEKTFNKGSNWIGTDYFRLSVIHDEVVTPVTPIANYQFDECSYTGSGNEVIDQIGNYSGAINGIASSSSTAVVNRSLDLSATNTSDWVGLPRGVIDGLNDFSLSVWINTSRSKSQQEIFHALGSNTNDDELEIYLIDNFTVNVKVRDREQRLTTNVNMTDGNWHHLVITREDSNVCLYVDNNQANCGNGVRSGTLSVPNNNSVVIGQEQDDYHGSFSSSQSFEGYIDELTIYDSKLTASEVAVLHANQNAGKNFDGSERSPTQCSSLMVHFEFNEGTGQTAADSSLPPYNGLLGASSSVGSNDPTWVCNSTGFQLDFDRTRNQRLTTTTLTPPANGVVAFWVKVPQAPTQRQRIFGFGDGWELRWESSGVIFMDLNKTGSGSTLSSNGPVNAVNDWVHIAAVTSVSNNTWSFYVNGVLNNSGSTSLTAQPASVLTLGTRTGASDYFTGSIDDFRIYNQLLSTSEIAALAANKPTNQCVGAIHHYEIVHDGNGLTCAAEPITIRACTNSSCSTLATESVSLDFQVTNSAQPPVTSTKQSVTFTGSGSFNFNHTTAEVLTLSVANATVNASDAVECSGVGSSCQMTFADAGFRFLYDTDTNTTIATQTAGTVFPQALKLQAVRNNSGVCEGLFTGNVNVNLSQQNITPDASYNAGLAFQTNSNNIAKHPSFTNNVTLNFGSNSIATIPTPRYLDAGQIRLHASYNSGGISLVGSSNDFWVKPAKFIMHARKAGTTTGINGNSATHDTKHAAGAIFDFSVEALNSSGTRVQNYRQGDGQLQLKIQRLLPSNVGTVDGDFSYSASGSRSSALSAGYADATLTSFSADSTNRGLSFYNGAKYSEVGVINVDIQDVDYGGLGSTVGLVAGDDITIGRFTPAYFKQTVESHGNLDANQGNGSCSAVDWAYTGQQNNGNEGVIFYGIEPEIIITAYNADNNVTQNYTLGYSTTSTDNFRKLTATGVDITSPTHDHNQLRKGETDPLITSNLVALVAGMNTGNIANASTAGAITYNFSASDHFTYTRDNTSFIAPFDAEIPFVVNQISDSDGITLSAAADAKETVISSGVNIRFARMVIENAFGPETANLRVPLNVQTFNGTNFIQANDESCLMPLITAKKAGTKYSGNLNLWDYRLIDLDGTDTLEVDDTNAAIENNFTAGEHNDLFFSAPNAQGALEFEYEVPTWLKFDWRNQDTNTDGPYTDNPSALLNFGLYRGNDRIISWREVNN